MEGRRARARRGVLWHAVPAAQARCGEWLYVGVQRSSSKQKRPWQASLKVPGRKRLNVGSYRQPLDAAVGRGTGKSRHGQSATSSATVPPPTRSDERTIHGPTDRPSVERLHKTGHRHAHVRPLAQQLPILLAAGAHFAVLARFNGGNLLVLVVMLDLARDHANELGPCGYTRACP